MLRLAVAPALAAILLSATATLPAFAANPPDAAQIRKAAEQYDAGAAAYQQHDYEAAASAFEAADAAVPSAKALRQAIRARSDAGQDSRAATLAALALERYAGDAPTVKLARETIDKVAPRLHKLGIRCASPCVLAIGTRSVPGEPSARWTIFLDPGKTSIGASFSAGGSAKQDVDARAGGASEIDMEPVAPPLPPKKRQLGSKLEPDPEILPPDLTPPPVEPPKRSGISPAFFVVGLVATAGVGGVTLWSGIDTKNNPGVDAVRKACAGKDTSCPEYQEGRKKQARTNILIGATAGAAAITTVFAIVTNWHGSKKTKAPAVSPAAIISGHGAVALATGTF